MRIAQVVCQLLKIRGHENGQAPFIPELLVKVSESQRTENIADILLAFWRVK